MTDCIKPQVGLLPLILELYDERAPELRGKQRELVDAVTEALSSFSTVQAVDICAREEQVRRAVAEFEAAGLDAVVVLFTAYAPSLIAADALAQSALPVIIFNTQLSWELDRSNLREELMRNHGMHGVQDLANLLLRRGKRYHIVTGHFSDSRALAEMQSWLRGCALRRQLRTASVGVIGSSFEGMGDFQFDPAELRATFGTRVEEIHQEEVAAALDELPEDAIAAAIASARERFSVQPDLSDGLLGLSEALSAAVFAVLRERGHCAWSMNFLDVGVDGVLPTVPFLAASRSMAEGYGYAGEGDALSALCVFIMQQLSPPASFAEMFCMDPKNGGVLLSHMGEANYAMADGPVHLVRKEFAFGDCEDPAVPVFSFRPGEATLVNLVAAPGGGFRFITARVQMQRWRTDLSLQSPQGYFKPRTELGDFLTRYSMLGGSHHLALTYGDNTACVSRFASLCGVECLEV